jgi:hypothetical protein
MKKKINVVTKSDNSEEIVVAEIVEQLIARYDLPIFTETVLIEKGVIPHSHPVLTLNTRNKEPILVLDTFVHEQLHWFAQGNPQYQEAIGYLKQYYEDNGEHNKSGTYPNSFWEHIIVCFNTRDILNRLVSKEEIAYIYSQWQAYPVTEKMIEEKFEHIREELKQFNMVYNDCIKMSS